MKRNVGQKTVHVLRDLLKKKFEEKLREIIPTFRHDFTYEKPYFDFTIRVDAYDFATTVMEQELSSMSRKLKAAEEKIKRLEDERYGDTAPLFDIDFQGEMTEVIYEFGAAVVAHQKKGRFHRLVICCTPPQLTSEWAMDGEVIHFHNFAATWDNVEKMPF